MNKKILAILAILIVATSISAVSAFDLGSLFGASGDNETVKIGGIDFNIPAGYIEDQTNFTNESTKALNQLGLNVSGKSYVSDTTGVEILVGNYSSNGLNDSDVLSNIEGNATKIKGVDGALSHDGDYTFGFVKDKCIVVITSNDKNAIGDFLIA